MMFCQFPDPGLKKLATSTFCLLEYSLWGKPAIYRDPHAVRKPKLALRRERYSAVLTKPVHAPNMQLKKSSWKFQPQQMQCGKKNEEANQSQT